MTTSIKPTRAQVRTTEAVVAWYLATHFGTDGDPGLLGTFTDRARVGAFAVTREEIQARDDDALFRLLIATTMFQRLRDIQILRILQNIEAEAADEMTRPGRLLQLVDDMACQHSKTTKALRESCDLGKLNGVGVCQSEPKLACHMKRHTVTLKRYGHFGKVPTSAALMLREQGTTSLDGLRQRVFESHSDPRARAIALEALLCDSWRINQKIASMYLSLLTNPDLDAGAPWTQGIDWTYYVVVDSNVDLFLAAVGYTGVGTYDARRSFVEALARGIDLRKHQPSLHAYNPRLVQQSLYLFMSHTNRRALPSDCANIEGACARCPKVVSALCSSKPRS
jgi:hypothetical protein